VLERGKTGGLGQGAIRKRALASAGIVVVVCLAATLVVRQVGLEPRGHRPGLWIRGEVVTAPVADWSFTDTYETILVETRSWYGLPHSVTVACTAYQGRLYVGSSYGPGVEFPQARRWNRNVMRDPRVRLKVGDRIYERTLTPVTDAAEREAVLAANVRKYPRPAAIERIHLLRVDPA
jgi:hypothetical protein